jgi:2-haloacid dehalogenase
MARRFDLILFDADGTLFDFATSERLAFANCLTTFVGAGDHEPAYRQYCEVSTRLWQRLEQGSIQETELRVGRWLELGQRCGYTWSALEVADAYLLELSRHGHLIDGALEVCRALGEQRPLGIVSNGFQRVQTARLAATALSQHIDFVVTSELAGAAKPARAVFARALELAAELLQARTPQGQLGAPGRVLMVGDSLAADIAGGRAMGFTTCWFNPMGLPAPAEPADYTIRQLSELLSIVC